MKTRTGSSMRRFQGIFFTLVLLLGTFLPLAITQKVQAQISEEIVISQVYGGGGNKGAVYKNDFIELYNPTSEAVSLEGWSVQYASGTGSFGSAKTDLSGQIEAYSYYLIEQGPGAGGTEELPTPDASGGIEMAGAQGKVALVNTTDYIANKYTADVVDYVGYGTKATEFEGNGPTKPLSGSASAHRIPYASMPLTEGLGNGWDTDDNAADFVVDKPAPRNSESPAEKFDLAETVYPIADRIQFKQIGEEVTVTGSVGTVSGGATVQFYESASKEGGVLGTAVAEADGSFVGTFSTATSLSKLAITATLDKPESKATMVDVAVATTKVKEDALSYMVDGSGKGTLIGTGAALAQAEVFIYRTEAAEAEDLISHSAGTSVFADGKGSFNVKIENGPDTVYVTQKQYKPTGIMLESTSAPVMKFVDEGVTDIGIVRETNAQGQPANLNGFFTIEGIVTIENGILGFQKSNFFMQDETGGINVFGNFDHQITNIKRGDRIQATGKVSAYNGLTQFEPTSMTRVSEGVDAVPAAIDLTVSDMLSFDKVEPLEGRLISVGGKVTSATYAGTGYNITITDDTATKPTLLRVVDGTGIDVDNEIITDKRYTFTGILGQYTTKATANDGYQLFPRDSNDIAAVLGLTHTPLTEAYLNTDVAFEAFADGATAVNVFYKNTNDADYTKLPMSGDSQGRYTAVLADTKITGDTFTYYIEATDGENSKFAGTSEEPFAVTLIQDKVGPNFYAETPSTGSKVESKRPDISVLMEDPSGVDTATVEVFLNGEKVTTANVSKTQVKFTPAEALEVGTYTVKVTAKDLKGNAGETEWTFEVVPQFKGGQHYRGSTHNHTSFSHDATGDPEDALKAGLKYNYDFFALTDHSHDLDPDLRGTDTVDSKGQPERTGGPDWQRTKDLATQYTNDGEYVVFPSYEMTATTWGHSNVFGTDNFIDRLFDDKRYQDLDEYYAWMLTQDRAVAQFNHPDLGNGAFNNFKPYDQNVDKVFTMFELGNGSRSTPSAEKKFFSALDLGWHVAPTYGEDHHKETWAQTNLRTVIVAEELTNESLQQSMRDMRVYMTEDPNFEMDVTANGYYMGSTADSKTLDFQITGDDLVAESRDNGYDYLPTSYKSDDRVKLVELVTNGGKVVDTYEPMTKDFAWEPSYTVASGQQWFVVRATQMDGERAYSAPIWSKEESLDLKVNSIDIEGDVVIHGQSATFQTVVGNFGTETVNNVNVKLYLDEVTEAKLIGSSTIPSIVEKGTGKTSIEWATPEVGQHDIIAVVTLEDGTDLGDISFTLPIEVKDPLGLKVLIDAKHVNENSSGDGGTYKDNLKDLILLLQTEGYAVAENKAVITADVLKDVNVLVITHPRTALDEAEQQAVADFVAAGGSVLMTGKSNNGSTNSTINNDLLAKIGTDIRASDDGVFDLSEKGNFWSDATVGPYAVRAYPGLVDNYVTDRVPYIDYYSGSSLQGPNNTALEETGHIKFLVTGNDTTFQNNIKNGSYAYQTDSAGTDGAKIPLIVSDEIGANNGRIIVSGMNIFNDKQMEDARKEKGNAQLALNAVNWLANRDTVVTAIEEARQLAENKDVVIEGIVTSGTDVFTNVFYVQDETGGIQAYNEEELGTLKVGDKVRIYGQISTVEGQKVLAFDRADVDVIHVSEETPIVPKELSTADAAAVGNHGQLVKSKGKVVSIVENQDAFLIDDGTGPVLVFVDGYIADQTGPLPTIKDGDTLEAVGLAGAYDAGARIRVRDVQEMNVSEDVTEAVSLAVDQTTVQLAKGKTTTLTVMETKEVDGVSTEKNVTEEATYKVADENVASVDKGLITAKATGETTLIVTYGENDVEVTITVSESGWLQEGDKWFYFDEEGNLVKGWLNLDSKWYYLDPTSGEMATGWAKVNGEWYYLNPTSGEMATGWEKVDGKWYYLDLAKGQMRTGWIEVDGKRYYLNPTSGDMATGWAKVDNKWYYLDPTSGEMSTGWLTIDGKRYYLDSTTGEMATGWEKVDRKWYYLDATSGEMKTGWLKLKHKWYYLDPTTGQQVTGLVKIDGKWYLLFSIGNLWLF